MPSSRKRNRRISTPTRSKCSPPTERLRRANLHLSYSMTLSRLLDTMPLADIIARSLDNFIGELLEMQRHFKAECLGRLEIDDKLELDWRLHRNLGGFLALENAIDILRRTPKIIGPVNPVRQQAANFSEEAEWIDGRETIASRYRCDLHPMSIREAIRHRDKPTIWLACLCGNNGFEFRPVTNRCCDRLHREGGSGGFEGVQPIFGICRRHRVEQHR